MRNKIYLYVIGILLLAIPLALAQVELSFPYGKEISLKRPCFNENGTFCSGVAVCNITITYPGVGDLLIDNEEMTNFFSYHNTTILAEENDVLGIYPVIMSCCDGILCGDDTFEFEITGDGNKFNIFPIEVVLLIISFIIMGVGVFNERFKLLKYLGSIAVMVLGVVTLYPGYAGINHSNLLGLSVGSVSIALGFYFLIEDSLSFERQSPSYNQDDDGRFHGND